MYNYSHKWPVLGRKWGQNIPHDQGKMSLNDWGVSVIGRNILIPFNSTKIYVMLNPGILRHSILEFQLGATILE